MRPILADAVDLARRALLELEPAAVGTHLGVTAEDENAATHRFEATLPGYRGWQWAVVVAAPPEADYATVSESALLPGPDALVAPDFVPWEQRIRPGDLAPGDLLAPPADDPRLVPGYVATGDPVVDEVGYEVGLGRTKVMSREGRAEAAERWYAEHGPDSEMAKSAPSTCGLCGFYLPLAGALRAAFGVCGNAMGADGRVVHVAYGCGAHSDTVLPTGGGSPLYEAYDDSAFEMVSIESERVQPEPGAAEENSSTAPSTAAASTSAGEGPEHAAADAGDGDASSVDAGEMDAAGPDSAAAETSGASERGPGAEPRIVDESAPAGKADAAEPVTAPESAATEAVAAEPAPEQGVAESEETGAQAGSATEQDAGDESGSQERPESQSSPRS